MLYFDDEEHIDLADALGIAPVDKDEAFATQVRRFTRAVRELRAAETRRSMDKLATVLAAYEATVMPGGSVEARLTRIEEKLAEILRRTEPA